MFNSHACVTSCPLCVTWVPRAGSPEDGEASGFSPVFCPDCAASLQQDLLPFQVLPATKSWFCHGHAASRHIRIPRSQPQTCWGVGAAPPSLLLCWEVTGDVCACREPAEEEVQDPKARAKANWLRAFNKVCLQLQEVRTPWPLPRLRAGCSAPFHTWAASRDIHGLGGANSGAHDPIPTQWDALRGREC